MFWLTGWVVLNAILSVFQLFYVMWGVSNIANFTTYCTTCAHILYVNFVHVKHRVYPGKMCSSVFRLSREIFSHTEILLTSEGLQILTGANTHSAVRLLVLLRATPTVTLSVYMSSPRSDYILAFCWAFDSDTVTTSFNDIRLLRSKFEHQTFRTQDKCFNQQRHRRSYTWHIVGLIQK